MTVTETPSTERGTRTLYIVTGVVVAVIMMIALLTYRSGKTSQEAEQKANQLIAAVTATGAKAPSQAAVVRVLGNDGGAVCNDPNGSLRKGIFLGQLMNGAAGPGMRPIIADNRVVKGQLLVLKVYCPDELPSFQQFVDNLNLSDTVKG
jgi:Tfp pilus assembly protein FimT